MSYKLVFLVLLNLSLLPLTWSRGGESHGGNSVICYTESIYNKDGSVKQDVKQNPRSKPEFKDLWEYRQLYPSKVYKALKEKNIFQGFTSLEIANHIAGLISDVDPTLGNKISEKLSPMSNFFLFKNNATVVPIHTHEGIIEPDPDKFCYTVQVAYFTHEKLQGITQSVISEKLFKQLSLLDQAALLVHEAMWSELPEEKTQKNKQNQFVAMTHYIGFVFSTDFLVDTFFDYYYLKNMVAYDIDKYTKDKNSFYHYQKNSYSFNVSNLNTSHVTLSFFTQATITFPGEIFDIGVYRPFNLRPVDHHKVCLDLISDSVVHSGSCD